MKADFPRDSVSEITEISDKPGIIHFCAAMVWGTFVGTTALLIVAVVDAGFGIDARDIGAGITFFGFFVGVFTALSMTFIGLPITWLLRVTGNERAAVYAGLGAVAGFAVLAVLFEAPRLGELETWLMPIAGAFAGFASALRWGRWRERISRAQLSDAKPSAKRDNPIHNLFH